MSRRRAAGLAPHRLVGWLTGLLLGSILATLFGAGGAAARPCATLERLAAVRQGAAAFGAAVQARPWDEPDLYVDSEVAPLRVHYDDALFASAADEVLGYADDAWLHQVVAQGWAPPRSDGVLGGDARLDIYLVGLSGADGLTLVDDDDDDDDGRHAGPVHIRVDPSADALANVVHHELSHASHFAVDASASLMLFEASAVLQEVLTLAGDDDGAWAEDLEEFQRYPQAPPFADGVAWGNIVGELVAYEYGAVLVLLYLEETYGSGDGVLVRRLWEASIQPDDVLENEPDWLDVLPDLIGVELKDVIPDFATWRSLIGPRAVAGEGPSVGGLVGGEALPNTRRLAVGNLRGQPITGTADFGAPHQLGCVLLEVRADLGQTETLEIRARSEREPAGDLVISWITVDAMSDRTERGLSGIGSEVVVTVELPEGPTLVAAVCDVSSPDADDEPVPHPVEIRAWNTRLPYGPEVADGGGPEPDPEPSVDGGPEMPPFTCGCQQAGASGAPGGGPFAKAKQVLWPLMLLLGLVTFAIRARRMLSRRKTYVGRGKEG